MAQAVDSHTTSCSRCGEKHSRKGQRYCHRCHAAYMRGWFRKNPREGEQRSKDIARSYAATYLKRGKIKREPCWCGAPAEMHHSDYSQPLKVEWLCRKHHLDLHVKRETLEKSDV